MSVEAGLTPLTQPTTKIVLSPIEHFNGARLVKVCWVGELMLKSADKDATVGTPCCGTTHGHQRQQTAVECAKKAWRKLPEGQAR